ncbi:MAG: elongation factor P [Clostridiales bacterium]|nr:elongation factor P [Clostridiales bacterium]
MNISDVKANSTIEYDGKLWLVVEYQKVSRPRLAALFRTKLKNIETGQVVEKNFLPSETVGEVSLTVKEMQYSYDDGDIVYFMDLESYDQVPFDRVIVDPVRKYIKDDTVCMVKYANDKLISIDPPTFMEMDIVACEPAVAGNTSGTAYKPATLETGLVVKVPLFVNNGDRIRVDTRTGEYMERVKN